MWQLIVYPIGYFVALALLAHGAERLIWHNSERSLVWVLSIVPSAGLLIFSVASARWDQPEIPIPEEAYPEIPFIGQVVLATLMCAMLVIVTRLWLQATFWLWGRK